MKDRFASPKVASAVQGAIVTNVLITLIASLLDTVTVGTAASSAAGLAAFASVIMAVSQNPAKLGILYHDFTLCLYFYLCVFEWRIETGPTHRHVRTYG